MSTESTKPRRGRPPNPTARRDRLVVFRVSAIEHAILRSAAETMGLPFGEFLRWSARQVAQATKAP